MAQIKFSKQHKLKEDKFIQALFTVRTQAEAKKKPILAGIAVVVVAAIIALAINNYISGRNADARDKFSTALLEYQEGRYSNAISSFRLVADKFSGSSSAPKALYLLGSLYYDLGNYNLAIETNKQYIAKYSDNSFMTPAVYKCLGSAYMQTKDYANAITAFQTGIKKCPREDFSVPELRFKLARCFVEKQDIPSAREQYSLILKDFPRTRYARESELWLASL